MSRKTNLFFETYQIGRGAEQIKQGMVQLFDDDYNGVNGVTRCWECYKADIPLCQMLDYNNEAEMLIDKAWEDSRQLIQNIFHVMGIIKECWGDYVGHYSYNVFWTEDGDYSITVAYTY